MNPPADQTPEPSNETLAAVVPPSAAAPLTVRSDVTPVSSTGAPCFGEYEVVGELGEGGMGRVYKARHRTLGQFVAIKVLTLNDPAARERFRSEALTTAKLEHAHIVRVIDVQIPPDGRPYLVMEFADGGSLDRELNNTPQNPYRAAEMLETIARAVQFAHEHGVLHRDLKPANVLRTRDGTLKLTDFGLAKQMESVSGLTRTGALLGTPQYMAPEQADGRTHEFGPAVDIYALGAILYEMLTGRPPFRGVTVMETLEQVRRDEPAPPSRLVPRLPRDLSVICLKCLEKAPGRRYRTAGELADDLKRWQNGQPIVARAAPRWERLWRQIARRPWESAAIAASVLLLVVLVAGGLYIREQRNQRALDDIAQQAKEERDRIEKAGREERERNERAANDRLNEQAKLTLAALDRVRDLVLDGELSRSANLGPLHKALGEDYRELLKAKAKDSGFERDRLIYGLVKVGDLFRHTGDRASAEAAYRSALERGGESADDRARAERAEAQWRLARVLYERRASDTEIDRAIQEAETFGAELRGYRLVPDAARRADVLLGEVRHLRGQLLTRKRQFAEAAQAFSEAIDLRARVAARARELTAEQLTALTDPKELKRELDALRNLGRGYGFRGDAYRDLGQDTKADADYWQSHHLREKVAAALKNSPSVADRDDAAQQLARSWGNFADLYGRAGALGTALHFAEKSRAAHEVLVTANKANVEYAEDIWNRSNQIAELHLFAGNPVAARTALDKLPPLPEDDQNHTTKRSVVLRAPLATAHALRAAALAATDAPAAGERAKEALSLFEGIWAENKGTQSPDIYYFAAVSRAVLAQSEPNRAAEHRARALEALAEATKLKLRGRNPECVKQFPVFAALRDDPIFTALLKQLDTGAPHAK